MKTRTKSFWKFVPILTCLMSSVTSFYLTQPEFKVTTFTTPDFLSGQITNGNTFGFFTSGWELELRSSAVIQYVQGDTIVSQQVDSYNFLIENTDGNKNLMTQNGPLDIEIKGTFGDILPTISVQWKCFGFGIFRCKTPQSLGWSVQSIYNLFTNGITTATTSVVATGTITTIMTLSTDPDLSTTATVTITGQPIDPTTIRLHRRDNGCYTGNNTNRVDKILSVLKCSQLCIGDEFCLGINYSKETLQCDLIQQKVPHDLTFSTPGCQYYEVLWKK